MKAPKSFARKPSPKLTYYFPQSFKGRVLYLEYARWRGAEVLVAVLSDKSHRLVALDDGSFRLVESVSVLRDERSQNEARSAFGQSYVDFITDETIGKIKTIEPLVRKGVVECENIPALIQVTTQLRVNYFALLVRANGNERCGPEAPYDSAFETFLLGSGDFAISPTRMFFVVGSSILSLPLDFRIEDLASCPLIISASNYDLLVDQTVKEDGGIYSTEIEPSLEKRLINYVASRKINDCE